MKSPRSFPLTEDSLSWPGNFRQTWAIPYKTAVTLDKIYGTHKDTKREVCATLARLGKWAFLSTEDSLNSGRAQTVFFEAGPDCCVVSVLRQKEQNDPLALSDLEVEQGRETVGNHLA